MNTLSDVRAGDKLLVKTGSYNRGCIVVVDRVTPTGRVVTKMGEFDPRGWKRGDRGWSKTYARPATDADISGISRQIAVSKLTTFSRWNRLNDADLETVTHIIAKYPA